MPLWAPSARRIQNANLTRYQEFLLRKFNVDCRTFDELYTWSVENPATFWESVWEFTGVIASRRWTQVLQPADDLWKTRWFVDARLNFAENLLRGRDELPALTFWNEEGRQRELTYRELADQVNAIAAALVEAGVRPRDRVAGFLPNLPETVIAMLATTSLGATWSSCSPDFGVEGVVDRFGQIQPKVLFAADGYLYAGKEIDSMDRLRRVLDRLPEIERVVVVPYRKGAGKLPRRAITWARFLKRSQPSVRERDFEGFPFDHPLYVLYSSGTTGLPKCMVHGAGGTLIQHLKELVLHCDLKPEDRIFYFTTCGWMMWNWLVSSLAAEATVVLYDGSPFHPDANILWRMAEREGLTIFGASAKYLSLLEKNEARPKEAFSLNRLQTILSTGSPLAPSSYDYVYREIKSDVCLSSISGGTDLISCFALGNPIGPVFRGELQTRGLGMKVEVFDEDGRSVTEKPGELVCTAPFPSMPVFFWNDPDGEKFRKAYFNHFPGVWRHGDWAEITSREGVVIYGRSDATLNPGGVRIGTAEIYRQVNKLPEVLESVAVGQKWQGDVRVVLFVQLRDSVVLTDELKSRIRNLVRENCSPFHAPAKIIQVPDIPRTLSGKITELSVQRTIHGEAVGNMEALANPEALEHFRHLSELTE
ncbi:MAG TPA: acetoacetate--CoA ligase [Acidobacteriota bacterium]|nr:acetoacetate--CoA ligase [Acidobacteriota bacterium]